MTDALALRASAYTSFRAPNLDELYRPYSASSFAVVPNSQLVAETLNGADAGIDWNVNRAQLQLNVFENDMRDLTNSVAIASTPVYSIQPVNVGKSRSRGLEFLADIQLARSWFLSGGYTYTSSVITENPDDSTLVGKTNGDVPNVEGTGTLSFRQSGWPSAFVRGHYAGARGTPRQVFIGLRAHALFQ